MKVEMCVLLCTLSAIKICLTKSSKTLQKAPFLSASGAKKTRAAEFESNLFRNKTSGKAEAGVLASSSITHLTFLRREPAARSASQAVAISISLISIVLLALAVHGPILLMEYPATSLNANVQLLFAHHYADN